MSAAWIGRHWPAAILAVALAVRLVFVFGFVDLYDRYESEIQAAREVPAHAMIKSDAGKYFADAVRIGEAAKETGWLVPSVMGPFLYPRLIALYGGLTGTVQILPDGRVPTGAITGLLIFQAVFSSLCLVPLFLALRRVVPPCIALIAALFLAVEPTGAQQAAALMAESIYLGLLCLLLAAWITAAYPRPGRSGLAGWASWLGVGLLAGLCYLHKPISILLPVILALAAVLPRPSAGWPGRARAAGLVFLGYAVVLGLLGSYNLAASGRFELLPGQASNDPMQYIAPRVLALAEDPSLSFGELNESPAVRAAGTALYDRAYARMAEKGAAADDARALNGAALGIALEVFAAHPVITAEVIGWHVLRATSHLNPFHYFFIYSQIYKAQDATRAADQEDERYAFLPVILIYSLLVLGPVLGGWLVATLRLARGPSRGEAPLPLALHGLLTLVVLYFPALGGWLGNDRYVLPNLVAYAVYWAVFAGWCADRWRVRRAMLSS